jgi:MFS family permease
LRRSTCKYVAPKTS